jgi:hypothetical protein
MRPNQVWVPMFAALLFQGLGLAALDMSPELVQVRAAPNARLSAPLTLKNDSTEEVEVRLGVHDLGAESVPQWVRVSPKKVRIPAGQNRVVQLKMRVPRIGEGERSAQVWAHSRASSSPVEFRLARRLTLRIKGTERCGLDINTVSVEPRGDRFEVKAEYQNTGNVTLLPLFGADLTLSDGRRTTGYQKTASSIAPGARALAHVSVSSLGGQWGGAGAVMAQYRDIDGNTHQVNKTVGD